MLSTIENVVIIILGFSEPCHFSSNTSTTLMIFACSQRVIDLGEVGLDSEEEASRFRYVDKRTEGIVDKPRIVKEQHSS